MNLRIWLPLWVWRRLVKRNPWLLADQGKVTRSRTLEIGPLSIEVNSETALSPEKRARLLAERK